MARWSLPAVVVAILCLAACDKPNGATGPGVVGPIAFRPVSDVRIDKVLTPAMVVTYPEPIADGGVPPLRVTCTPPSGSSFPVGATLVTCTATDGVRFAESHFTVTIVRVIPVIALTKFLAFGDSLTAGEVQDNPVVLDVRDNKAYPTVLAGLLRTRYASQTITMVKSGLSRETAGEGMIRLPGDLFAYRPDVLLLHQGILELTNGPQFIPAIISALRTDVQQARQLGVKQVFLSTLMPEKTPFPGFPPNNYAQAWVEQANASIRALAIEQNTQLVDLYAAMVGKENVLIGGDGLHPTEQGYVVMAETFMTAIQNSLELPPGTSLPSSGAGLFLRPNVEVRPQATRQPVRIQ